MPLPLAALAVPVAVKVGIGIGVAVLGLAGIGVAAYKFKTAKKDDKADLTILLVGEQAAGKDTVFHVLKGDGFIDKHDIILNYETIIAEVKKKKIKIINTSGSESAWRDVEKAKGLEHQIRCYVFNSKEFYSNKLGKIIKLGINDNINECRDRKIDLLVIGTRGDEVNNKNDIEKAVENDMGVNCKIFELSKNPKEELIKYVLKI